MRGSLRGGSIWLSIGVIHGGWSIELGFRGLGRTPFQMAPPTTEHLLGRILGSPYLRKKSKT